MGLSYRLPRPGERVGDYLIVQVLGAGGQGHAFKARWGGQSVFLKFMSGAEEEPWGEQEGAILLLFKHPHVVRCLGLGRWPGAQGHLYLAMEYVEGETLERYVQWENPGARGVAQVARGIAGALGALHARGVVHRDVKLSNLMVRSVGGEPVVVDLGLAHLAGARTPPALARVLGTPEYFSPEMWRHLREQPEGTRRYVPSAADDLWALGLVLYWLLTGRTAFGPGFDGKLGERVLGAKLAAPHEVNGRVPEALSRVCMRMLERELAARLATAEAVCGALEEALACADASWEVALGVVSDGEEEDSKASRPLVRGKLAQGGRVEDWTRWTPTLAAGPRALEAERWGPPTEGEELVEVLAELGPYHAFEAPTSEWLRAQGTRQQQGQAAGARAPQIQSPWERSSPPAPACAPEAPPPRPECRGGQRGRRLLVATWGILITVLMGGLAAGVLWRAGAAAPGEQREAAGTRAPQAAWAQGEGRPGHKVASASEAVEADAGKVLCPLASKPEEVSDMRHKHDREVNDSARQSPSTLASRTLRSAVADTVARTCVGLACCAALAGCASGAAAVLPPGDPAPQACSRRALEDMRELGIRAGAVAAVMVPRVPDGGGFRRVSVQPGPASVHLTGPEWGQSLGKLSATRQSPARLVGTFLLGKEGLKARFYNLQTPSGKQYRVCFEAMHSGRSYWPLLPESTSDHLVIGNSQVVQAVDRFE